MFTDRFTSDHCKTQIPRILILSDYYVPAFKAGGPVRTIEAMIHHLNCEFSFLIITRDRDHGDVSSFKDIKVGHWQHVDRANVYYAPPAQLSPIAFCRLLNSINYDLLYINSFLSFSFSILPLLLQKLRLIKNRPVILAPRGEFSPGAIRLKQAKKRIFLIIAKSIKLHDNIIWQASSEFEAIDIQHWMLNDLDSHPFHDNIRVAVDLSKISPLSVRERKNEKREGVLRIVFLSRISPMKNLDYALNVVRELTGTVVFDIYGPINTVSEKGYWLKCQELINQMPESIRVNYRGIVEPTQVQAIFSRYDLFLFPTRGENFGHVILESLSAGCPVLISDQTPWKGLSARKAGWDLALDNPDAFVQVLEQLSVMSSNDYAVYAAGARALASETINCFESIEHNRRLFLHALSR